MRVRFKFKKTGRLKYIGHLDLLNIWNRAVKSAKLPIMYSNGFNPHMLMSFAAPLSLGITSIAEYVDIDFEDGAVLDDEAVARINERFPADMSITGQYMLTPPYARIAAIVSRADYSICTPFIITSEQIDAFLKNKEINIMKKTKSRTQITDIRPDIFAAANTDKGMFVQLACGSFHNLKPTLFIEALCGYIGITAEPYEFLIERTEIYTGDSDPVPLLPANQNILA